MAHYAVGALLANHKQEAAIAQLLVAAQNFDAETFDQAGLMLLELPSQVLASLMLVTPTSAE